MMSRLDRAVIACLLIAVVETAAAGQASRMPSSWLGLGYTLHDFGPRSPIRQWLYVQRIAPGSPALQSGLRVQDAIVAINGKPVRFSSADAALDYFASIKVGTVLHLTVLREQKQRAVTLRAAPIPAGYAEHWKRNAALAREVDAKKKP